MIEILRIFILEIMFENCKLDHRPVNGTVDYLMDKKIGKDHAD